MVSAAVVLVVVAMTTTKAVTMSVFLALCALSSILFCSVISFSIQVNCYEATNVKCILYVWVCVCAWARMCTRMCRYFENRKELLDERQHFTVCAAKAHAYIARKQKQNREKERERKKIGTPLCNTAGDKMRSENNRKEVIQTHTHIL